MMKNAISILIFALVLFANTNIYAQNPPQRGYRGFAETGYSFGLGNEGMNRFEISTTHGFQFNEHLFIGGGVAYHSFHKNGFDWEGVPVFGEIRGDWFRGKFSPFASAKLGYNTGDIEGLYFAPAAGCRYAFGKKFGLNLSLGYSLQMADFIELNYDHGQMGINYKKKNSGAITLKLGFDF